MINLLRPVVEQFAFNGSLFALAFENVSAEEARAAPSPETASLHWIAAHVVTARYHTLRLLRVDLATPWEGRYEADVSSEVQASVSPERIATEWERVTPRLMSALAKADQRLLHTAPPSPFPTIEQNTLAALAFMANHEAYHIGQLSYVRKMMGKTPLVELLLSAAS